VAYVGLVDPNQPGHYPVCPFLRITGWWCPGCGGLRCVHALTRGDLRTALHDNVLVLAACTAAVLAWLHWTLRSARGQRTGRFWPREAARSSPADEIRQPGMRVLLPAATSIGLGRQPPTGPYTREGGAP